MAHPVAVEPDLLSCPPHTVVGGLSALREDGLQGFEPGGTWVVRYQDLYRDLPSRGNCRHRALILESIHDASGGIQSLPEHDFELIRRRFCLPEPSRQSVLRRRDGRFYLDVEPRRTDAADRPCGPTMRHCRSLGNGYVSSLVAGAHRLSLYVPAS